MIESIASYMRVLSTDPSSIQIEITDSRKASELQAGHDSQFRIGGYVKVQTENNIQVVAFIKGYRIKDRVVFSGEGESTGTTAPATSFIIDTQPLGYLKEKDGKICFYRGLKNLAIPPAGISFLTEADSKAIFTTEADSKFNFSHVIQKDRIGVFVDGDKFFSKHIGVVGSTGSGKSCTVAKILQNAVAVGQKPLNNSHTA